MSLLIVWARSTGGEGHSGGLRSCLASLECALLHDILLLFLRLAPGLLQQPLRELLLLFGLEELLREVQLGLGALQLCSSQCRVRLLGRPLVDLWPS